MASREDIQFCLGMWVQKGSPCFSSYATSMHIQTALNELSESKGLGGRSGGRNRRIGMERTGGRVEQIYYLHMWILSIFNLEITPCSMPVFFHKQNYFQRIHYFFRTLNSFKNYIEPKQILISDCFSKWQLLAHHSYKVWIRSAPHRFKFWMLFPDRWWCYFGISRWVGVSLWRVQASPQLRLLSPSWVIMMRTFCTWLHTHDLFCQNIPILGTEVWNHEPK